MKFRMRSGAGWVAGAALALALMAQSLRAEVILQYFNTSWREIANKVPELAEVGYDALWLPPPTKGSGGLSVGYDLWDPFDLGGKDQRNSVRTRYGTEADLQYLIQVAHRYGIRIYFDNIMNHRAFDVPGFNEYTPIDIYPGMVPEDFHLRVTSEGFYRKWDNIANWGDTWQIQYRNFSDLIDIAQESPDNGNFGASEGSHVPKIRLVRHPNHPEYYCFAPSTNGAVYVGFGSTNITPAMLTDPANAWLYEEDVNAYLIRAVRWLVDRTKADGLRLDAVKHVPDYFFGEQYGAGKDSSGAGYLGQAQEQFNVTRGFSDWNNHRDSVFSTEVARDDLMMFGEHLGEPPGFGGYIDAGMRLVDSQLHGYLNGNLGSPWGTLDGLQVSGGHGFSAEAGVAYVKSHDDDYATRQELQFALVLTRVGLPTVYTDGNYQAETLGESGGAFPRHANTAFLGQFGDNRIPNLVYIHNHFARGFQRPRWGDGDVAAYERIDKRENSGMTDADGTTLFFVMNDNYSAGQYREIETTFPVGAHLWQYSSAGGGFYYVVPGDGKIKVITPPGGYFAFSWRSPEPSSLWEGAGGRPVTIYENGEEPGWVSYDRHDGPDGDPAFNPYGVADTNATDFTYTYFVPRVTSGTNLSFVARVDGSAANVLLKLDNGIDLNGLSHALGDMRDHPPGIHGNGVNAESIDPFLGYEQAQFVERQFREKFAARDTESNNVIGSAGAETYEAVVGQAGFAIHAGVPGRDSDDNTVNWAYHDPADGTDADPLQFFPAPESAADTNITVWLKLGYENDVNRAYIYYTTDGQSYPEGAGGVGMGKTRVAEMVFDHDEASFGFIDWWRGTLPPLPAGTVLRYKLGAYKEQGRSGAPYAIYFPNDDYSIGNKRSLMGVWQVTNFNATVAQTHPHGDYGAIVSGLSDGFHVLRSRAFLERSGRASIYSTFVQPFYYDAATPAGDVVYPSENDTLGQNEYGVVVRADQTVTEVWYNLVDAEPANDDSATGIPEGNGQATNGLGGFATAWVKASPVTASLTINSAYPNEWRFSYRNIPSGHSNATIRVRLMELSSSTNLSLSDADGHYTTLERHVWTDAPAQRLFFDWPTADGTVVDPGWIIRVRFSKILGDGIDDATLRNRFLVKVDGAAVGKDLYTINRDVDGANGELSFAFPNVYNGDPNALHAILVTHVTGTGVTLEASRYVRTRAASSGPHIDIVQPLEFDSDGKAFEIVLPDVAAPAPGDRQFTIRVETDLSAKHVWLMFTNSVGGTTPYIVTSNRLPGTVSVTSGSGAVAGHEQALTGTVSVPSSNTVVTGSGTRFTDELLGGEFMRIATNYVVVTQVASATELTLGGPYPGDDATNETAYVQPAFDTALQTGSTVALDGTVATVQQIQSSSNLTLTAAYAGPSTNGLVAYKLGGNPSISNGRMYWQFLWTNMTAGRFTFYAFVNTASADTGTVSAYALRNTTVLLRETVPGNPSDYDDDDDGLYDTDENTPMDLPTSNPETWLNGDVHVWQIYGRTGPQRPDTDGDGLPDGLESGWRLPFDTNQTNPYVDTNGDGFPNFRSDLDPPFYNTVPDNNGLPEYVFNDSRTKRIHGSMTDPNNPDSDYDGIRDSIEDRNRNGWADGDGLPLQPGTVTPAADRPNAGDWPDGKWKASWQAYPGRETDPNKSDTDEDGAGDGYGEDVNFNGGIDGDTNSNRTHEAGELWAETDPLNPDTDGDGLPDGWEKQYGLDPLDGGVIGRTNLQTGTIITDPRNGAAGNPDGDFTVTAGVTNQYSNQEEFQNGTNPTQFNSLDPPPAGSLVIGSGPLLGTLGGLVVNQDFLDWTWADCRALDEYEGDGNNNQQGDLYLGWDGWDSSRDIVAFYTRDGGDAGSGGDGNVYFRIDLQDLKANAEEGNLDLYVVIDTGNPASGEMNLPDEVDALTLNRWEAVVAVYDSSHGRVYVDLDRNNNTTSEGQGLASYGVEARDQNAAYGFIGANFNANLDAVEFAISRQALRDAGWSGSSAAGFHYQVFTTKDGTGNSPVGAGDIGGRNDIRDAIYNDYVAEDYWQAQQGIDNTLRYWINGDNRVGRAKVAVLLHGNQALLPGSDMQALINTGAGAGYYRPLEAHALFGEPLGLHVTATLASALEWAAVDPAAGKPWRDGPAFNRRIGALIQTNVVELLGSTFSDHMLPYFTSAFNAANEAQAREVLQTIYGPSIVPGAQVFWTPERLLDQDVFSKIQDMGYGATILDQDTHIQNWFGRTESLIDGAYRANVIDGVTCFTINTIATASLFSNNDGGVDLTLRSLLNRKARSGTQDQVVTLFSNWEAFADKAKADAYDLNLRWIANHPWIKLVTHGQIARGEVDVTGDGSGDTWGAINRGSVAGKPKQGHNWLNHATQENYDNWYVGSANEESLQERRFEIRPGTNTLDRYGMLYTSGIVPDAWADAGGVQDGNLRWLAQATLFASVFQTAFHAESESDLRRYSTGDYIVPATGYNTLAAFARNAQAQTRKASLYAAVEAWTNGATAGDVDQDGEPEYVIANDRLLAIAERIGGRVIGVWARNTLDGEIMQVAGNFAGYEGTGDETEGTFNVQTNGAVVANRTSLLKDWWVATGPGTGTSQYVNDLFGATAVANGWRFTSSDGKVQKTITLAPGASAFEVEYALSGDLAGKTIYVRNGLSPNLRDLLLHGQQALGAGVNSGQTYTLASTNFGKTVVARVGYADAGHSAGLTTNAVDDSPGQGVAFDTVNLRNQAQTEQVEVYGTGALSFSLGFTVQASDWDVDGMPNTYESAYGFLDPYNDADGTNDFDADGLDNRSEYIAGTAPDNAGDLLEVSGLTATTNSFSVRFPAKRSRAYSIWYETRSLRAPAWSNATPVAITVPADTTYTWTDTGSGTGSSPGTSTQRFYRVNVDLPE
ncbi:MAG: hypothetical protein K8T26_03505 [Lentisphaerae bacterium]|nr:hypothetical protein [Lentisphaerota bacterium]